MMFKMNSCETEICLLASLVSVQKFNQKNYVAVQPLLYVHPRGNGERPLKEAWPLNRGKNNRKAFIWTLITFLFCLVVYFSVLIIQLPGSTSQAHQVLWV